MGFEREQLSTLLNRLNESPQRLTFVTGPRQCGKTTLVDQTLEHLDQPSLYLPVDEPESLALPRIRNLPDDAPSSFTRATFSGERDSRWVAQAWERARVQAARSQRGFVLVFDEIQKIPNWSEIVKGLWDADRREHRALHVVLLGSSPLLMHKGTTESLAGRFESIRLAHWSFQEMATAFGFDFPQYVYFGGYPGAAPYIHEEPRWRDYVASALVEPNIERDIVAMDRIDKPALLKRLFELSAEFSGQILAYSKMVGQLDDAGNTTTLARYLQLLERAGLVAGLSKYEGLARRQRASSPKLNVLNTALTAVHSGYTFEEAQADRTFWGRLVESAVGAHLYNTGMPEIRLYYWRRGNHEVDFVLERGRRLVSIEVKSNGHGINLSGRGQFAKSFNPERSLLVGRDGISIEEFLSVPASHWFDSVEVGNKFLNARLVERPALGKRAGDDLQVREQRAATTIEPSREYDAGERQRREAWHNHVASQAPFLRENRAPPALLYHLATAYFGDYIDAEGDTPGSRLLNLLEGDGELVDTVIAAFRSTTARSDLPEESEIVRLASKGEVHYLSCPFMAGLEELDPAELDERQMRLALTIHFNRLRPEGRIEWYASIMSQRPDLVADILVRTVRQSWTRKIVDHPALSELADDQHAAVAALAIPKLLRSFPPRATSRQLTALKHMLRAAVRHCPAEELVQFINRKLAIRSMNVAQRIYWCCTGLLVEPAAFTSRLQKEISGGGERRVRHVASYLASDGNAVWIGKWNVPELDLLIRSLGHSYRPSSSMTGVGAFIATEKMEAAELVELLIGRLSAIASTEASEALEILAATESLSPWRERIRSAQTRQRAVGREANFRHANVEQVLQTLDNASSRPSQQKRAGR